MFKALTTTFLAAEKIANDFLFFAALLKQSTVFRK
jgi:hypothetical protein